MQKKELPILLCLAFAQFTNIVDFMIIMPLGPDLIRILAISTHEFSLLVASYSVASGISAVVGSFIVDDFDRKKTFLFLYLGFIVGTFLCALAPTYEWLLFFRFLTGLCGGLISSQVYSIVGDIIPFERRGRATGIVMGSFSLASIVGVPLGLILSEKLSWHAPFILLGVTGVFLWLLCYKIIPPMTGHLQKESKRSKKEIYIYLFDNPQQFITLSLFPILMMTHFIVIPLISSYMFFNVGFEQTQLSYIYFFGGLATIFTSPFTGKLIDKYGAKKVYYVTAILALPSMYALTHLPQVPIWLALVVVASFFVFGSARTITAMAAVNSAVPSKYRGGFLSLNTAAQSLGSGVASYVAGVITSVDVSGRIINYDRTFYVAVFFTVICFYVFSKIKIIGEKSSLKKETVFHEPV